MFLGHLSLRINKRQTAVINIRKYERISVKVLKSFFFPKMRSFCLMFIIAVCFLFLFKMKYIFPKSHMLPLEISACQYFGKQAVPDPDRGGGGGVRPLDKGKGGGSRKKKFSALRASVWSTNKGGGPPPAPPLDPPLNKAPIPSVCPI